MHILFTSSWFPTEVNPYNGDFVQRHAKAVSQYARVTVLYVEVGFFSFKKEVVNTVNPQYEERIIYIPKSKFKILNLFKEIAAYNQAVKRVEKYHLTHANVIYLSTVWVLLRKIFFGGKYVLTEHWTDYDKRSGFQLPYWRKKLAQLITKRADCIFPVSKSLQKGMQLNGMEGDFEVIPNVVDTTLFNIKKKTKEGLIRFLHVSSMNESQKNISGIIEVLKILKSENYLFEFYFVGNDKRDDLKTEIKDNKLDNTFIIGALPHEQIAAYMQQADCLVMFSNYENQPCVIAESFSCGLPVISTSVGGIAEFFPDNFGFLIEKGNQEQLYHAMRKVIQDHQFVSQDKMRDYAIRTFSQEVIGKRFFDFYSKIIHE